MALKCTAHLRLVIEFAFVALNHGPSTKRYKRIPSDVRGTDVL